MTYGEFCMGRKRNNPIYTVKSEVMVYVRKCKSLPSNGSVASRSNWGSAYLSGDLHDLYRVIIEEKQRWHVVSQWGSLTWNSHSDPD